MIASANANIDVRFRTYSNQLSSPLDNQKENAKGESTSVNTTSSVGVVNGFGAQEQASDSLKQQFTEQFRELASDPDKFHELLKTVFGTNIDRDMAVTLRKQALKGDFSWMPKMEMVSSESFLRDGVQGNAAYAAEENTIYLSESILDLDPKQAQKIFNEEMGHALDAMLNSEDTKGDEGDLFSRMLSGESIDAATLKEIQNEDDSGTIFVNGREVEVEFFGFIKKAARSVGNAVKGVANAIGDAVKGAVNFVKDTIVDVVSAVVNAYVSLWEGIMEEFKSILLSKWFQTFLVIARFIPIPAVQAFAAAMQMLTAIYQVYEGVRTGNFTQAAMGVLTITGTGLNNAKVLGLSASTIKTFKTVQTYGQYGMAAYQAKQTGRVDGLIMAGLSGQSNETLVQIRQTVGTLQKAEAIKNSIKNGDEFGALLVGYDLAGSNIDKNTKLGSSLGMVRGYAGVARNLENAIEAKDWNGVADIIERDESGFLRQGISSTKKLESLIKIDSATTRAEEQMANNDMSGAALSLMEAGYHLSEDKALQTQLKQSDPEGKVLGNLLTALGENRNDDAMAILNEGQPGSVSVGSNSPMTPRDKMDAIAISRAMQAGDMDKAATLVQKRMGTGDVADVRQMLQAAVAMGEKTNDIPNATNNTVTASTASKIDIPLANRNFGEQVRTVQVVKDAINNERSDDATTVLNASLGKELTTEQWAEKLDSSAKVLEGPVLGAVEQQDWAGAVQLVTDEINEYIPIDPAISKDAVQLTDKLINASEATASVLNDEVSESKTTRKVESGQTLSELVNKEYGVTDPDLIQRVARHNGLADAHSIQAGQELEMPSQEILTAMPENVGYAEAYKTKAASFAQAAVVLPKNNETISTQKLNNELNSSVMGTTSATPPVNQATSSVPSPNFIDETTEQVGGFFVGASEVVVESVEGAISLGGSVVKTAYDLSPVESMVDAGEWVAEKVSGEDLERPDWMPDSERGMERLKKGGEVIEAIIEDPGKLIDAVVDPIKEDWEAGRQGEAIGRGVAEVAGLVLGGKGIDKLSKGTKVADAVSDTARISEKVTDVARVSDDVFVTSKSADKINADNIGKVENTGLNATSNSSTMEVADVVPGKISDVIPESVVRSDRDFSAKTNHSGQKKSFIDEEGTLRPANVDGDTTIQQHVRGGDKKSDSPYISTTDPDYPGAPKDYGDNAIKIDTKRLQNDIKEGKVKDTEIIPPMKVQAELQSKIDIAEKRYNENPSEKNITRLEKAQKDLEHAVRDNECLIKGCVPSDYIKGPNK